MKTEPKPAERHCLFCDKVLDERKRKDSKYCNEYCKAAFHNPRRAGSHPDIKRINKILAKNFFILQQALGTKDYIKKNREKVLNKGFNLEYFTHLHKHFKFCYRYGYYFDEVGEMVIFKGYDNVVMKEV